MKKRFIINVLAVAMLSLSLVACGQSQSTTIEGSASSDAASMAASTDPNTIVDTFVSFTNENYMQYDVTLGKTKLESYELSNTVSISGWNNDNPMQLAAAYVVTSKNSDFKGVVITGTSNDEPMVVYFYADDSGKIATTDGYKLSSFLPLATLQKIQK